MNANTPAGLPNFADLLLDAVFMVDLAGCIVYVNAASERIFGYRPDEMIGKMMIDFIAPEDRAKTREEAEKVIAGQDRIGFENRYIRKDGRLASIMWSARWSEADQLRIGVARDITEREQAKSLQAATYAISEAAHVASDLPMLLQEVHQIIATLIPVSGFAVSMRNQNGGALSFPYQRGGHDDAQQAVAHRICAEVVLAGQSTLWSEPPACLQDAGMPPQDTACWLAVPLVSLGKTMGAVVVKSHPGAIYTEKDKELLQFVSKQVVAAIERKQLHIALLAQAQFDELTGLPNRRLFHRRAESALATSRNGRTRAAILYIDLDDFKQVNDSFGHAGGDLLLQEVARRLKQCMRESDTVARLGGDEFVALIEDVQLPEQALAIAEKIRTALSQDVIINGNTVRTLPSIGIALSPDHGDGVEQLLRHADKAMYSAKKFKASAKK